MKTITHSSGARRAQTAIVALTTAILFITAGAAASAAATGSTPGPIPNVRLTGTGAQSVSIAWDEPWTDGGAAVIDYRIDVRMAGGQWRTVADGISVQRAATVGSIETGIDHEVRVAAINENGVGPATTLGALSSIEATGDDLCGKVSSHLWTCFANGIRQKSVSYGLYPNTTANLIATDIIDFDGLCAVSASAGVLCRSVSGNRFAELGQGLVGGPDGTFVVPGLPDNLVAVNSTRTRACVIDDAAQLWCWGKWASLASSTLMLNPTVVKRNVAQFEGSCVRFRDNTVECVNVNGEWSSIPNFPLITKLANDSEYTSSCGITVDKQVVCFDTVGKSFRYMQGWENVIDLVDGSAMCALIQDGTVKCYGNNFDGELGNGTKVAGYGTALLPEPAIAVAAHRMWDSNSKRFTCAIGVSGSAYCWGAFVARFSTRLTTTTVPLSIPVPDTTIIRSMPTPAMVGSVEQVARSTDSVSIRWTPIANVGSVPLDGYQLRWSADGGNTWNIENVNNTATTWTRSNLASSSSITVTVAGFNAAGVGPSAPPIVVTTTSPPARPASLSEVSKSSTSTVVRWVPSPDEDEPITGYHIQWRSTEGGWRDVWAAPSEVSANLSGLPGRSAIEIRIRAENAAGVSAWTGPIVVSTTGTGAQQILVRDSFGSAVIGGQVTWVTPSRSFESALDYGLTFDGSVTFPVTPAGPVNLTLRDVVLPGGAIANFQTRVLFGAGRTPLVAFPAEPSRVEHVVRVTLPNGLPVVGASVTASGLEQFAAVDGATFATPELVTSGFTNEFGEVYLVGYSDFSTAVTVEYNDGVLIQRLIEPLGKADASFQLEEMPWIDTAVDTVTTSVGQLVSVPVVAETSAATVRIVAPATAPQTCAGRVLSARVNSSGRATLKVCATNSGTYRIQGAGAVATDAVSLQVRGTKSMGVTNAIAESRSHRTAIIRWSPPSFTGGHPITSYTVKLIAPNGSTISRVVTSRIVSFTGLSGAVSYVVKIVPTTRLGNGATITLSLPVS